MNETELIMLARQVEHQYSLERYSADEMIQVSKILKRLWDNLNRYLYQLSDHKKEDLADLLDIIEKQTTGTQNNITGRISAMTGLIAVASVELHSNVLSWNGEAKAITPVTLDPKEMAEYWKITPVGGYTLQEWVNKTFSHELKDRIQDEIMKGMLDGDNYHAIQKRLKSGFKALEGQMETMVKTYVQSANMGALEAVYERNSHIIKSVRWIATFEGGLGSGKGTCLRCASLDGRIFPRESAPKSPLHPRCRCVLAPVTDIKRLQLTQNGKEKVMRPYKVMEDGKVTNGKLKILEAGRFKGTFEEWLENAPEHVAKNIMGPKRLELWKAGKIAFRDLVTKGPSYRIKRLNELPAMT